MLESQAKKKDSNGLILGYARVVTMPSFEDMLATSTTGNTIYPSQPHQLLAY
jgi:hypothetical protein